MRKVELVKVPSGYGRDHGKTFQITEWPATRADEWAVRAILAYNRGGSSIPLEGLVGQGMEAIFFVGVQTFLRGQIRSEEIVPILNELLDCVQIVRDPAARDKATGKPVATDIVSDDDIEEVKTRWWLRSEVIRIHTGFSPAAELQTLISAIMKPRAAASDSTQT